jgi:hypothetical protein
MRKYTFWLVAAFIAQVLTALVHSISFFAAFRPAGEADRELIQLMHTYRPIGGGASSPTLMSLFNAMSVSFLLLYLFGAMLNFYLWRMKAEPKFVKGFVSLQMLIFGASFGVNIWLTFLPPILLTGLVFILLVISRITFATSKTR